MLATGRADTGRRGVHAKDTIALIVISSIAYSDGNFPHPKRQINCEQEKRTGKSERPAIRDFVDSIVAALSHV